MKWKEKFLVPDALLMEGVDGASYDGFYYIVHDQVTGNIQGFYYHQDAEKFQQLELVPSLKNKVESSDCSFEFAWCVIYSFLPAYPFLFTNFRFFFMHIPSSYIL